MLYTLRIDILVEDHAEQLRLFIENYQDTWSRAVIYYEVATGFSKKPHYQGAIDVIGDTKEECEKVKKRYGNYVKTAFQCDGSKKQYGFGKVVCDFRYENYVAKGGDIVYQYEYDAEAVVQRSAELWAAKQKKKTIPIGQAILDYCKERESEFIFIQPEFENDYLETNSTVEIFSSRKLREVIESFYTSGVKKWWPNEIVKAYWLVFATYRRDECLVHLHEELDQKINHPDIVRVLPTQ